MVLLGNGYLPVYVKAADATAASKKPAAPTEGTATEKPVLAESSKQAAKPEPATTNFCRCVGEGDNSMSKKIEKTLASPLHRTGLDYADQPLEDVATQLGEEYGIPIQINKAALDEAVLSPTQKSTYLFTTYHYAPHCG
jgi:hypothetical protein